MTFTFKAAIAIGIITGLLVANGVVTRHWIQSEQLRQTVQVCSQSRAVNNRQLEQRCGDVQDHYNTEFLCTSVQPGAYCWAEKD